MKSLISATDATARAFFTSKAFAVVGASSDPAKFGHQVFAWYLVNSLPVTPLNPHSSSITVSGKSFATVSSVSALPDPTHTGVSIITPPSATLKVLRDAHEAGVRAVWLQPGTWDEAVVEYLAPGEDGVSPFETVVAGEGGRGHGGCALMICRAGPQQAAGNAVVNLGAAELVAIAIAIAVAVAIAAIAFVTLIIVTFIFTVIVQVFAIPSPNCI
ncbi:acetyl coenzyme A synthetase (ADP forming) alpha domain protein [Ceratocystis platani]|uniref:Acetyl coenzyme A synthetase (ADP forming) alpha domain protein n=1 Tax=Ceratocystis fimbriata f. sp. platani TaxID=88771 RepID=A0A0F8DAW4_CERFI|nr:acetyl coenzyme A synthetase (ADP forming) alpha domain protein [Ceratocystis platani]